MGQSQRLEVGTIVKLKGKTLGYQNPYALVVEHDASGAVFLQTEGSDRALVARHEISVVRNPPDAPLKFLRHRLPYGRWTCSDGREVLFNRDYKPIWQRQPDGKIERADEAERVRFNHQEWFYDDVNQPWRSKESARKCNRVLTDWGVATI